MEDSSVITISCARHLHRATARRLEFFSWDKIAYEIYRNFGIKIIKEDIYYEPIRYAQNEQFLSMGLRGRSKQKKMLAALVFKRKEPKKYVIFVLAPFRGPIFNSF